MGFANYIKSRILSADPKFRNDKTYLLFMLLVKELNEIKNSEQTLLRKSTKCANLTASLINSIGKENLYRYNSAFSASRISEVQICTFKMQKRD